MAVMVCAVLWGFWWLPVSLMQGAGLNGPWIALAINLSSLPVAVAVAVWAGARMSGRAVLGGIMIGLAITLYALAAAYTDFIRAVLLFYLAPAWSTLIEVIWFRRRWTRFVSLALSLSFVGILLISRGEIEFSGLGALGDWMALGSGLSWSIGVALLFSGARASTGGTFLVAALSGAVMAGLIGMLDGSMAQGWPSVDLGRLWASAVFACGFMGILLGGTLWGAFQLPPTVMTYLLSLEIIGGVFSSAVFLDERFGWFEAGGAVCILSAVLVEVLAQRQTREKAV